MGMNEDLNVSPIGMAEMRSIQLNRIWDKWIPRTNTIFLVLFLLLIFGVDLVIILNNPDLFGFWAIMLIVFAGYCIFFFIENFKFNKKLATSQHSLDTWIFIVVILRNILFLLNFIPFIQLLGLLGLPTVGVGLLVVYIILVVLRMRRSRRDGVVATLSPSS